jgi:glycosyltransferase involved in cell wall biosynthesis
MFFKMARWEAEKGWMQTLDALQILHDRGERAMLVARSGGPTNSGDALSAEVNRRGMTVADVRDETAVLPSVAAAARTGTAVVNLRFGVREPLARALYAAADGVLANSISEPFGLVGLEAMAAGGIVYTGGTGEDYAVAGHNAMVLETLDPEELVARADWLAARPDLRQRLRRNGRATARRFVWDKVVNELTTRIASEGRRGDKMFGGSP